MTERAHMDIFEEVVRSNRGDGKLPLPSFVDPIQREIRALAGLPDDVEVGPATRDWAAEFGRSHYLIGIPENGNVLAEEYLDGQLITFRIIILN